MERIVAPIVTPRPDFKLTDSGDDFHIELDRIGTFMAEMLVAVHLFEEKGPRLVSIRPVLHDWFDELHLNKPGPLPAPEVDIDHQSLRSVQRTASRSLFYSGITHLVSGYEQYLSSIAEEMYRYNRKLLSTQERQLTSAEIIALGSYDRIMSALERRATSNLTAPSYPALVKRFNREFHVGIHHDTSPVSLFVVHHLMEQRHLIVHNGGRASDLYLERMSIYEGEPILKKHSAVPVDFKRFFDLLYMLSDLGNYIDEKVKEKWITSTS